MQQSSHYGFNKPDYADQYDLRHWNENTDSLDTILNNNGISPNNDANALGNRIDAEKTARENADSTLQSNITSEATARGNADTAIRNDIGNGTLVAKKAEQDQDGNNIKSTYATKDEIDDEVSSRQSVCDALEDAIDDIVDGTTTVKKAYQDKDGNNIDTTYQKTTDRVNSWQSTPDNTHYPSEKLVKDSLDGKMNKPVTSYADYVAIFDGNGGITYDPTIRKEDIVGFDHTFIKDITVSKSDTQVSTTIDAIYTTHGPSGQKQYYPHGIIGYDLEFLRNYSAVDYIQTIPYKLYLESDVITFKGLIFGSMPQGVNNLTLRLKIYTSMYLVRHDPED